MRSAIHRGLLVVGPVILGVLLIMWLLTRMDRVETSSGASPRARTSTRRTPNSGSSGATQGIPPSTHGPEECPSNPRQISPNETVSVVCLRLRDALAD